MLAVNDLLLDLQDFPDGDSMVVTGLLRFLLEPDPDAVMDLVDDASEQSDDVVLIAAVLSGALHGRSRIPLQCRPEAALQALVNDSVTLRVNQYVGGPE